MIHATFALLMQLIQLISFSACGPLSPEGEYKENPRAAYDALTFLTAMNAFPDADIPGDRYMHGWQQHRTMASHPSTRTAWQNIGPNNVGGRTVSIAIHPVDTSIVWLGSASGGLWKSTSGGIGVNAWEYVPIGYPVLGVGAIAINPQNTQEMLIGTGETYAYGAATNGLDDRTQRGSFGMGMFKSTDGGVTWEIALDWTYQDNRGIWEIIYNPANPATVFAATTEGVYKTYDGGLSWMNVLERKMVMDLVLNPADTNVIFAGVGNEDSENKGIYRSTDGGATWEILSGGLPDNSHDGRITISASESNPDVLMAIIGNRYSTVGVYRTGDGGDSWELMATSEIVSYQGWYAKGLLIKADDPTRIIAGGVSLFKSSNSGDSFSGFGSVHSDIHDIIANPLDLNKIYVITDGGLYRCNTFAGNNWYACTNGYVTTQFYIGSVSAQNAALALGGLQDNGTVQYSGSQDWEDVLGGDGCWNLISPANDDVQFACYQYLNITKSSNGGNFFNTVYSSPSDPYGYNPAAFLGPLVMSPAETNVIYAGSSTLLKSTNTGGSGSWNEIQEDPIDNENPILSIGVSSLSPDTVYFSTAPRGTNAMHFYRSVDGGETKEDITAGLPNRYARRITVHPLNAQIVYAVFSGFSGTTGGHIFKSTNAGSTWTDVSISLPDIPFHCLVIDPAYPSNLYAGSDFTVYVSSNGGDNWFTYADGLPEAVMIFDLVISPSDQTLLAFTHGNGVYRNDLLEDAVSVSQPSPSPLFSVYPNPVTEVVSIQFNKTVAQASLALIDYSGKEIAGRKIYSTRNFQWNLPGLPQGNYLLQAVTEGKTFTQKIAVIH